MSDDIRALLEATTPTQLAEVDYGELPRRGRRRRRAKRVGSGVAVASAAVVVAAVTTGLPGSGTGSVEVAQRPPEDPVHTLTADGDLDDVGAWSQLTTLPSGARVGAFADALPDGRVLVYGGRDDGIGGGLTRTDGLLIDPETSEVTPFPDPPLATGSYATADLAGDRLLVFGGAREQAAGAVYDVSAGEWTAIPAPTTSVGMQVLGWNGEVLITGHTQQGPPAEQTIAPTETPPDPPQQPVALHRWSYSEGQWAPAAPTPLVGGFVDAARYAFDGSRLAVWIHATSTDRQAGQAAIYNVDTDQWIHIDDDLLPSTADAGLAWINDGLAVVPTSSPGARPVIITDSGTAAQPLPNIPHAIRTHEHHLVRADHPHMNMVEPGASLMALAPTGPNPALPMVSALQPDGTWTPTIHARQIVTVDDTMVALSLSPFEFPGTVPLEAAVLTDHGWAPAPSADRNNRAAAGIAITDQALLIVGGWSARPPQPGEEPDQSSTEDGAPDPYVLDLHDTVIRLDVTN